MDELRHVCDEAYEKGSPVMKDDDYDAIFGDVSSHAALKTGKTTTLPVWMGSLNKTRNEKSLNTWLEKTSTYKIVASSKLDGISALYNPVTNTLYTRGNGVKGCDISRFVKHINMSFLAGLQDGLVRGELIMKNQIFAEKYEAQFKNPRNLVAGQFGKKNINESIVSDIDFVPYEIITNKTSQPRISRQLPQSSPAFPWVQMSLQEITVTSLTELLDEWTMNCDYAMDGLVVTEDRVYVRNTEGNPKHSIAFKKETDDANISEAEVTSITWNLSKWGMYIPVVNILPVSLSGVVISKLSGHNAKYVVDNKIGPGAHIAIVRSGDVIPYIVSVMKQCDRVINLPSSKWDGVNVCIENTHEDDDSSVIEIKTLTNIFSKLDVKHVNTKTIEKMYLACHLDTFPKMLNCSMSELRLVFKEKTATRIIVGMGGLKETPIKVSVIVGASGVLGYGLGVKRVENLFTCLPSLRAGDWKTVPSVDDVCRVEGFATRMAEKVVNCFPMMTMFIDLCLANDLQLVGIYDRTVVSVADEPPTTKKICLSGFRDKELEQKYTVLSSVTKECELLICKSFESETTKMVKARKLGIKIILVTDLCN